MQTTPTARAARTVQLLERKINSKDRQTMMPDEMH